MDFTQRQIVAGIGISCAYLLWYAYRTLTKHRCQCDDCLFYTSATGYLIERPEVWRSLSDDVIDTIKSTRAIALGCCWSTDNTGRRRVALLQIATSRKRVCLIRILEVGIPEELAEVLKDPSIIKLGVGILEDATKIHEDYRVQINGCLDLRYMALKTPSVKQKLVNKCAALKLFPMAQAVLGHFLGENPSVADSNWEVQNLTSEQVRFATGHIATVFEMTIAIAKSHNLITKAIAGVLQPHLWLEHFLTHQFSEYIGIPFRWTNSYTAETVQRAASLQTFHEMPPYPGPTIRIDPERAEFYKNRKHYTTRKTPLYDNCVLLCPDSEKLCNCDRRKAQWYIDHNLGELVHEEPFTVRLKFEPSQRAILDGAYYSLEKENQCVCCGKKDDLVRKYVVPREYRKHFPKVMKHHNAHDVVLTCVLCHQLSTAYDEVFKGGLSDECNAPLDSSVTKYRVNQTLREIASAANALLKHRDSLPEKRREHLEQKLQQHFDVTKLTDDLIKRASGIDCRENNANYVSHGQKVIDHYAAKGALMEFETLWREFFVDSMNPRFMPEMWSANHHHDVLAVKLSLIKEADPTEAQSLMKKIGITEKRINEILSELEEKDKINYEKISIIKGRIMDNYAAHEGNGE